MSRGTLLTPVNADLGSSAELEDFPCALSPVEETQGGWDMPALPLEYAACDAELEQTAALVEVDASYSVPTPSTGESTLAQSVVILLVMSIAQRVVGLARGLLVCLWLTPALLGTWDLANRFFFLAAPLIVLGVPGTFGRYLEHYRQRGVLRTVLFRTAVACGGLSLLAWGALLAAPGFFAEQVFGSPAQEGLLVLSATCLLAVIAFNYLSEALVALRLVRVNAILQFLTSIGFAALSIGLLWGWRTDAAALIVAYAGSCLLLVIGGGWYLRHYWRELPADHGQLGHGEMWAKLLPFAGWIWLTNLLTNSYESAGRYMIVHHSGLAEYDALVGNYHAAQLVPGLIITLASMFGGILLPYLSRDWEAGRRGAVSDTLNLSLKLLTFLNVAAAAGVLFVGHGVFEYALRGKYPEGERILHLALANCAWSAAAVIAQMYLWCAEKARWGCLALALGLVVNVLLNWLWLPQGGLAGGMLATAVASLAMLGVLYGLCVWLGMRLDGQTVAISVLPGILLLGLWPTLALLAGIAGMAISRPQWLFSTDELQTLARYNWLSRRQKNSA
ncbi:MAG: lipopolysaccharide biosynthesis protein [Pirellulales bacterium]|nr:lipopolysaccharide biosynthesis protein [Pirellulales bacterium]